MKYAQFFFILACMLLTCGSCKTTKNQLTDTKRIQIQESLEGLVINNDIPGINFSYIDKNNNQYDFSAGFEDINKRIKLNRAHTMFSGSVGKTYAAAIIFQLIEEEKIGLNDKILKHLPSTPWLQRIPNINDITVRMLLRHTSGLPRWVMKLDVWKTLHETPNKVWSYEDRFSFIFDDPPVNKAGEKWAYSDTNYIFLGWLLESVLKKDYYDILHERILEPLELHDTHPSLKRDIKNLATAYSQLPEVFKIPNAVVDDAGRYVFNPQIEWTGGGLASTTSDLVKWTKLYYNSDLLTQETRDNMFAEHDIGKKVDLDIHSYGMGTFIFHTKHGIAYGHSGFMPGYNTIMAFFPTIGLSCAIQINCDYSTETMPLVEYLESCVALINDK